MPANLYGARLKIKRANEHIGKIHDLMLEFAKTDFYSVRIENDAERRINFVCFDADFSAFPSDDAAVITGDALHNLKSALDFTWWETVIRCGGQPDKHTRFPIRDAGDELVAALNGALKQKQITAGVVTLMLDSIKPYQGGDNLLWGLHDLNIRDKHQLLIPNLKLVAVSGVRLEDEKGLPIGDELYIFDTSCRVRLRDADDKTVQVKDKGKGTATILFDLGTPFAGEAVFIQLKKISAEVTRTVDRFERLLGGTT